MILTPMMLRTETKNNISGVIIAKMPLETGAVFLNKSIKLKKQTCEYV